MLVFPFGNSSSSAVKPQFLFIGEDGRKTPIDKFTIKKRLASALAENWLLPTGMPIW